MDRCGHCSGKSPEGFLCRDCVTALAIELGDVAGILPDRRDKGHRLVSLPEDLQISLARLDQLTDPNAPRGGSGTPLVFRPHVAESVWILHQVLSVWVRELGADPAGMSPARLARWLLVNMDRVQKNPDAGDLFDEVVDCVHQARRAIDRPSDSRIFLGRCERNGCTAEIYGVDGWSRCVCERCGAEHETSARREWLRDRAENHPASAPVIAGFLRLTGIKCTAEQVRGYAHRGRLTPVDFDDRGRPQYLINDVLNALRNRYVRQGNKVHQEV